MDTDDLDYDLPAAAIAQVPVEPRHAARLLVDRGPGEPPDDATVAGLPGLVGPGDVLVVNDTRVWPVRLRLAKPTGGAVEVLLLERLPTGPWEALVRPSRRVAPGTVLEGAHVRVTVGADLGEGRRRVAVEPVGDLGEDDAVAADGEVPLPPYIHAALADPERYQVSFAEELVGPAPGGGAPAADGPGGSRFAEELRSVAAPTAGLHLTPEVLAACEAAGAGVHAVRLAVGLGTFRPITTDRVEDHRPHAERYRVPTEVLEACRSATRVVAVGTTVVRALESAALGAAGEGRTDLYIHGDHPFEVVDLLLTNFHVPRSSLLALVDAFVGPRWRRLYEEALRRGYRFLSFGDAMLLDGSWGRAA